MIVQFLLQCSCYRVYTPNLVKSVLDDFTVSQFPISSGIRWVVLADVLDVFGSDVDSCGYDVGHVIPIAVT